MSNKIKVVAKNYGFEAVESYNKYVPNSDSTQEDIKEICLQYLLKGYDMDRTHAYWAWLHFCESMRSPWMAVTSTYDVPQLLRNFVILERPKQ